MSVDHRSAIQSVEPSTRTLRTLSEFHGSLRLVIGGSR